VLLDKIILDRFSFKLRFWLPQPYILGDPQGFYEDLFKNMAFEAEKLGFEAYLNLCPSDVRPRLYELVVLRILAPYERNLVIIDTLERSINELSNKVAVWVDMLREGR
jgi:hypothetical protein